MPRFSDDDVMDFKVAEAVTVVVAEDKKAEADRERKRRWQEEIKRPKPSRRG